MDYGIVLIGIMVLRGVLHRVKYVSRVFLGCCVFYLPCWVYIASTYKLQAVDQLPS